MNYESQYFLCYLAVYSKYFLRYSWFLKNSAALPRRLFQKRESQGNILNKRPIDFKKINRGTEYCQTHPVGFKYVLYSNTFIHNFVILIYLYILYIYYICLNLILIGIMALGFICANAPINKSYFNQSQKCAPGHILNI